MVRASKYPRGWSETRIRKVIEYYDSQTEDEEVVEIETAQSCDEEEREDVDETNRHIDYV
jgi:hypothetical protein